MGANNFTNIGAGKTMGEAFDSLVREDRYENGHRYDSGTIGACGNFTPVELPKGLSASDLDLACMNIFHPQFLREDSERYTSRKAEHVAFRKTEWGARCTKVYKKVTADPTVERMVVRLAERLTDKGECVGVELTGKAKADYLARRWGPPPKRGSKVFYFFGLAPS